MTEATPSPVQTLFNEIAPVYDRLNGLLSLGQHRIWKTMTVQWAHPNPAGLNVDLCCGSGDIALLMARFLQGQGQVVGIDFAPQQLAIARKRAAVAQWSRGIEWVEADVLQLPLESESVDAITMGYGLRNVADIPQCLAELFRILKSSGRVAILDFNRPESGFAQQFQQWYLRNVVVPVASQFNLRAEYEYLETSLAKFPVGLEQVRLAQTAGFASACHYPIAGGMMGVLVLAKSS
jgi:demethylphylloquinol methyltransferase